MVATSATSQCDQKVRSTSKNLIKQANKTGFSIFFLMPESKPWEKVETRWLSRIEQSPEPKNHKEAQAAVSMMVILSRVSSISRKCQSVTEVSRQAPRRVSNVEEHVAVSQQ